jgi:enamine deaminase RidA (YjgF/YER057c/UK114 family)
MNERPSSSDSPHTFVQPPGWPPGRGYAHGLLARGRTLYVAGLVGWDPETEIFASDDFGAQAKQALANLAAVLAAAGALPAHLARLTWFITDRADHLDARGELGAAYRALFGRHFPPMSVVVVRALLEPRAKVEIEATAVIPD